MSLLKYRTLSIVLLIVFIQEIYLLEQKIPTSKALLERERRAEYLGKPKVADQDTFGGYDCKSAVSACKKECPIAILVHCDMLILYLHNTT